jgi:two-component system chemotaxis response regulator CheB
MPASALTAVPDAIRAPAGEIGMILGEMSRSPVPHEKAEAMDDETLFVGAGQNSDESESEHRGPPSVFTCPECHGTLFRVEDGGLARYRCRVGHGFSAESLLDAESGALEAALWSALRTLQERNDLMRRMAERARRQGQHSAADRFEERVREGNENAAVLRQLLLRGEMAHDDTA